MWNNQWFISVRIASLASHLLRREDALAVQEPFPTSHLMSIKWTVFRMDGKKLVGVCSSRMDCVPGLTHSPIANNNSFLHFFLRPFVRSSSLPFFLALFVRCFPFQRIVSRPMHVCSCMGRTCAGVWVFCINMYDQNLRFRRNSNLNCTVDELQR